MRIICATAILAAAPCCNRADIPSVSGTEFTVRAVSEGMTRGYVDGVSMAETHKTQLHSSSAKSPRTLYLTAWHYKQAGGDEEYFRNEPFILNANGESDDLWHHPVPVYWPMGGTLDVLSYTSSIPFPESSVEWGRGKSTEKVYLTIDKRYTQDDILFAYSDRVTNGSGISPWISMTYSHAQAWIEFIFHCSDPSYDHVISVKKVVLEDIYTSGVLLVEHPYGFAEGSWSYRFDTRMDTVMDDNNGVYSAPVTTTASYLDMLIPEQKMKNFMLYYTIEGTEPVMQYEYTLPAGSTWQMGKKYIYDITFSPTLITVATTVSGWADGGSDTSYIPEP